MAWPAHEKETTQKLLREFILQLCRLNVGSSGCYEVDGIICITRGSSGRSAGELPEKEQIVVKVHEQVNIDMPCNGQPQSASASVLKEYLSSHVNHSLSGLDRYERSAPPLNLKRKANDENDNAIIDIRQTYPSSGHGSRLSMKQPKTIDLRETGSGALEIDTDKLVTNSSAECMPHDLTKGNCENYIAEDGDNVGSEAYCCGTCLLDFDSHESLKQHFSSHHGTSLDHFCTHCAIGFVSIADLSKHNSASHGRRRKQSKPKRGVVNDLGSGNEYLDDDDGTNQKPAELSEFEPKDGNMSSVRSLLLRKHAGGINPCENSPSEDGDRMNLDAGAPRSCPICPSSFANFQLFNEHCRATHHRFACPYCLQTFTQRVTRDRHLYSHTGEKPFPCNICGSSFTRKDALKKHQLKANHQIIGDDTSSVEEQLPATLADLSDDSVEEGDISQGEECGLDLSVWGDRPNSTEVVDPDKSSDGRNINFTPKLEDGDQQNAVSLKVSPVFIGVNNAAESKVPIPKFSGTAPPAVSSARLRQPYFAPTRVYSCDICHQSVVGATEFEGHCRSAHRRTPCVYCGKTFSQKGNMERHQRQHTGERPFACPHCSCSYTRKETLKVHINQAHPGARLNTSVS